MTKTTPLLKTKMSILMMFSLIPLLAQAEAGKSIDSGEILFALLFLAIMFLNQIYLTLGSLKRILFTPIHKTSTLHIISIIISIVGCIVYFSDPKTHEMGIFGWIVIIPCFLGIISLIIEIDRRIKQQ